MVEDERVEAVRREVLKIQEIVNRLVEMARDGRYVTREYLTGQQMTDVHRGPTPARDWAARGCRDCACWSSTTTSASAGRCATCWSPRAATCWWRRDGLRALEILNRTSVDIVVSDVVMPDLDGYDLFMEVRRRGTTPVILMTGYYYDRDHVIKRSRLEGLESVIFKKPIDPARLKAMIRTLTGRAAAAAPA